MKAGLLAAHHGKRGVRHKTPARLFAAGVKIGAHVSHAGLLVRTKDETKPAGQLICLRYQITQKFDEDCGGNLVVHGAATVQDAILYLAGIGVARPTVPGWNYIQVHGKRRQRTAVSHLRPCNHIV